MCIRDSDHGARGEGRTGDGIDVGLARARLLDRQLTGGSRTSETAEVLLGCLLYTSILRG